MNNEGDLDSQGGGWVASQYILKVELPGIADGLDAGSEGKRQIKNNF